jgi:hypothetical protein
VRYKVTPKDPKDTVKAQILQAVMNDIAKELDQNEELQRAIVDASFTAFCSGKSVSKVFVNDEGDITIKLIDPICCWCYYHNHRK